VAVDDDNRIHVVYFNSAESSASPAGLYTISSSDGGNSWSQASLLYPSRYFRSLTPDETHAHIASADNKLYVVWDSRPEEIVYVIKSEDGGATWGEPVAVDQREAQDGRIAIGPSQIMASAAGDNVLLVWQANHDNAPLCNLYYQVSNDAGMNWSDRAKLDGLPTCPDDAQLLTSPTGDAILAATGSSVSYLMGWDWDRMLWSNPQRETIASQFTNSDTFRTVQLGCQQVATLEAELLSVVGCGTGTVADIWAMQRTLQDFDGWFPSPTDWRDPTTIASGLNDIVVSSMVVDAEGQAHLLWSDASGEGILYTRQEDNRWTAPIEVLRSPEGRATEPTVAIDPSGRLYAVWTDPETGELFFSQANASRAAAQAEWAAPQLIAASDNVVSSPQLVLTDDGQLVVMYAAPLNEGRGIYMIVSADNGATWSSPALVFDAAAAGWTMVEDPYLHIGADGKWRLLWTQHTVPGAGGPIALYSAESNDDGATWSTAELVSDVPVYWSRITTTGENGVHRVWQAATGDLVTLWHQYSDDGGISWDIPTRVSSFSDAAGPSALVRDEIGRLHLLQLQASGLHYWLWDGGIWTGDRNVGIVPQTTNADQLQVGLADDGSLIVVLGGAVADPFDGQTEDAFFSTGRSLDYPVDRPTPVPTAILESAATPTPDAEPTPAATPTLAFPLDPPPASFGGSPSRIQGLLLGAVAATVFVILAFIIGVRLTRSRHRRT
jgi:hypothetical protein